MLRFKTGDRKSLQITFPELKETELIKVDD